MRVGGRSALLKFFDGITSSAALLGTQIDCSEMAFAKLALDRVLLTESVGIISTNNTIVDVCTVAREVFDNSNLIAILVFAKQ